MSSPVALIRDLGGDIAGVIHVGAHSGQEFSLYREAGLRPVVYIEALPSTFQHLAQRVGEEPEHLAINALCADQDGNVVAFNVSSNQAASSSLLDFGWHKQEHPEVEWVDRVTLTTTRLDTLMSRVKEEHADLCWERVDGLVLDVQGAELKVLAGAERTLADVNWVFTEVNDGGLYRDDCSFDDIYAFFRARGFRLKHLAMTRHRWGNALFGRDCSRPAVR